MRAGPQCRGQGAPPAGTPSTQGQPGPGAGYTPLGRLDRAAAAPGVPLAPPPGLLDLWGLPSEVTRRTRRGSLCKPAFSKLLCEAPRPSGGAAGLFSVLPTLFRHPQLVTVLFSEAGHHVTRSGSLPESVSLNHAANSATRASCTGSSKAQGNAFPKTISPEDDGTFTPCVPLCLVTTTSSADPGGVQAPQAPRIPDLPESSHPPLQEPHHCPGSPTHSLNLLTKRKTKPHGT